MIRQDTDSRDRDAISLDDPHDSFEKLEVFVEDLPTTVLRVLLRDHIVWMFVGTGVALIGFILPSEPWFMAVLRFFLFSVGLLFAGIRLFQTNAILAELRRRQASTTSSSPSSELSLRTND